MEIFYVAFLLCGVQKYALMQNGLEHQHEYPAYHKENQITDQEHMEILLLSLANGTYNERHLEDFGVPCPSSK